MLTSLGVYHLAIVNFKSHHHIISKACWTDHFPYDFSHTIIALLWSLNAHAVISEAEAEFQLIITTIFQLYISQLFILL